MGSTLKKKTSRFILITGLTSIFLLVLVTPVSAELRTINPGATVFIGESNLDITNAVRNSSLGIVPVTLGWWPSNPRVPPSKNPALTVDVSQSQISSFFVNPQIFDTGNWYVLQDSDRSTPDHLAFVVADPTLDLRIWDLDSNTDVTGGSVAAGRAIVPNVPQGDHLTFKIYTNQYLDVDPQYRPNVNPTTDGFITINLGGSEWRAATSTPCLPSFLNVPLFVDSDNWQWGGSNSANTYWATGSACAGHYQFYAESNLNNMLKYYFNGGVSPVTGKTVSNNYYGLNIVPITSTTPRTTQITTLTQSSTSTPTKSPTIITTLSTTVIPVSTQTTEQTIVTTTVPTISQTTIPLITPNPTATLNYSATIAAMQSQIAEQNAKIEEQRSVLDQITHFLREVFGWK